MRGIQRPCRFGPNCNKLAQGTCTFYHPPSDMQSQPPRGQQGQGSGFQHHSFQGNYQPRNFGQNPNYQQGNNPRQPQGNFNPNYNPNIGSKGLK